MAISLSKKKPKAPKKVVEPKQCCSSFYVVMRFLYKVPIAISLLVLIYLWSSSSTIISGKIVHICVSSRKLNSLYCLSAGTQPNFEVPVPLVENITGVSGVSNEEVKYQVQTPIVDGGTISTSVLTLNLNDKESSSPIVDNSTSLSPVVNVEVKKEITSLNVDSSTILSPIVNEDVKKEITSLNVDNSTILSPIVNVEVKKEISSLSIENSTILSPVVNEVVKKEITSLNVDNSTILSPIVNDEFRKKLQISSPVVENSTIIGNLEVKKEENVLQLVTDKSNSTNFEDEAAKDCIRVLRAWTSNKRREGCEGNGIYVYDLPTKFNKDLIGQCSNMSPMECKHFTNQGLGEPIPKLGKGWYKTHQYSLEPIFHSRALKHPCRVYNESEAKLFYVPFYAGLDVLRWHFKNVSNDVKDSLGSDLIKWLGQRWTWNRNSGKDHVFVLGKISWDFRRQERGYWGTRLLEFDKMQNPVKVLIERQPWRANDVGVPHPTYFHPNSDEDILSWQAKIISSYRRNLVGFAGAARPEFPDNIRSILIEQCSFFDDEKCKFLNCSGGVCKQPEPVIELFVGSEFCLQPPGDSPTRKSVFDSLVSGCIPVLFDPYTAYYQYPWHLPEDHGKYSVFIEQEKVRKREVNVIERLMKISKKEKDDMRRFIVYELLPGLVYGDNDSKFEMFQDSFSITINSLLERVNSLGLS